MFLLSKIAFCMVHFAIFLVHLGYFLVHLASFLVHSWCIHGAWVVYGWCMGGAILSFMNPIEQPLEYCTYVGPRGGACMRKAIDGTSFCGPHARHAKVEKVQKDTVWTYWDYVDTNAAQMFGELRATAYININQDDYHKELGCNEQILQQRIYEDMLRAYKDGRFPVA